MIIVSNTTPLIGMATIGQFELLQKLFGEVYIPQAVYEEATADREKSDRLHEKVASALWLKTIPVKNQHAVESMVNGLDRGEVEAIVLAQELGADLVLMDERRGRRKLTELGIEKIGTVGILLKAKEMGLIQTVKPELEQLQERQFRIGRSLFDSVLRAAGEV